MKVRTLVLLAGVALASACSNSSPPALGTPTLQDEYEPIDPLPASGGVSEVTFHADGTYFLQRVLDASADEVMTSETGTYALDVAASTLTMTPTGGAAQTYPIKILLTGTPSGSLSSSSSSGSLHTLGTGTDLLELIISFVWNGFTFHTDTPATPDGAGSDDAGWGASDAGASCGAPATAATGDGVDVSHYQASVDWATVKTTRNWAYAKASEGTTYTDPKFATNFAGIQAAGLSRGAYHFFRPGKDALTQADHFASILKANGYGAGDLAPMVDVEVSDGESGATIAANLRTFVDEAQAKLGATLLVYTAPAFWKSTMGNPDFSGNPLWIAHYTSKASPTIPSTWSSWAIWQYTKTGSVKGVSGAVDADRTPGASGGSSDGGADGQASCGQPDAGDAGPFPEAGEAGAPVDAGLIPGNCNHDVCTAGERLGQACDSCTMVVCEHDPYCCDTYWGLSCFPDVQQYCGKTCP